MQAHPEVAASRKQQGVFYEKGDEYSLSGDRFLREQVGSSQRSDLFHPHVGRGILGLHLVLIGTLMGWRRMVFTMLMVEGCDFYYFFSEIISSL